MSEPPRVRSLEEAEAHVRSLSVRLAEVVEAHVPYVLGWNWSPCPLPFDASLTRLYPAGSYPQVWYRVG